MGRKRLLSGEGIELFKQIEFFFKNYLTIEQIRLRLQIT